MFWPSFSQQLRELVVAVPRYFCVQQPVRAAAVHHQLFCVPLLVAGLI
jgi:hypothetical protein